MLVKLAHGSLPPEGLEAARVVLPGRLDVRLGPDGWEARIPCPVPSGLDELAAAGLPCDAVSVAVADGPFELSDAAGDDPDPLYLELALPLDAAGPAEACVTVGNCELVAGAPGQLSLEAPLAPGELEQLAAAGLSFHPTCAGHEHVLCGVRTVGSLHKPAQDQSDSPLVRLDGMQRSASQPLLTRPFVPAGPAAPETVRELIAETMAQAGDWQQDGEDVFCQYTGLPAEDETTLAAAAMQVASGAGAMLALRGDDQLHAAMMSRILRALWAGSRTMRAELARAGADVAELGPLGRKDCTTLALTAMAAQSALRRATGDARGCRVWSLGLAGAMAAEQELSAHAHGAPDEEMMLAGLFGAFDLGVRYQLARCQPAARPGQAASF